MGNLPLSVSENENNNKIKGKFIKDTLGKNEIIKTNVLKNSNDDEKTEQTKELETNSNFKVKKIVFQNENEIVIHLVKENFLNEIDLNRCKFCDDEKNLILYYCNNCKEICKNCIEIHNSIPYFKKYHSINNCEKKEVNEIENKTTKEESKIENEYKNIIKNETETENKIEIENEYKNIIENEN
jgi:hypothetical protein